jgi:hypothetical protein
MTEVSFVPSRRLAWRVTTWLLLAHAAIAAANLTGLVDRTRTFGRLHVNAEGTAVVWLSSATLLAIAVLAMVAATRRQNAGRGWWWIAGLFALLSLDEVASLHELAGSIFAGKIGDLDRLPDALMWVVVVAPVAAFLGFLMVRWMYTHMPRIPRLMALAAYGLWLTVPLFDLFDPGFGWPEWVPVAEESIEGVGEALMLGAMLLHLGEGLNGSEPAEVSVKEAVT